MGKNSSIEWTHHTFNPWWGCEKVSQACKFCYAEAWAKRVGEDIWGRRAPRRFFSEKHWQEPLKWNASAAKDKERRRVFCASMADVFEKRADLDAWRTKLWPVIEETPWLDWLLLTKRPENIGGMVPWKMNWPSNIWLGTTVENQRYADERIPHLVSHAAACRFLSCEPLLGALDLAKWFPIGRIRSRKLADVYPFAARKDNFVDWIIAGGESGSSARPMHPDWARNLRDQCAKSGVAFHFKQWGHWSPIEHGNEATRRQLILESATGKPVVMEPLGKKAAGRLLDGRTWDQFPIRAAA